MKPFPGSFLYQEYTPWTKKVSEEVKKVENMFFGQNTGKSSKTKPRKVQNNVQSTAPKIRRDIWPEDL